MDKKYKNEEYLHIEQYFLKNPNRYSVVKKRGKAILYFPLLLASAVFLFKPDILPFPGIIVRIVFGVAAFFFVCFFLLEFFGASDIFYDKENESHIKNKLTLKFDNTTHSLDVLMHLFVADDFETLLGLKNYHDVPTQLDLYEDEKAEIFYLQLMHYYDTSERTGCSEVRIVEKKKEPALFASIHKQLQHVDASAIR